MISRREKRFRRNVKDKTEPYTSRILALLSLPFMPIILRIKKVNRFRKVLKGLRIFWKFLIKVLNLGITGYELYNNFIKDFLEKRKEITSA